MKKNQLWNNRSFTSAKFGSLVVLLIHQMKGDTVVLLAVIMGSFPVTVRSHSELFRASALDVKKLDGEELGPEITTGTLQGPCRGQKTSLTKWSVLFFVDLRSLLG